jgi:hypothetical protein
LKKICPVLYLYNDLDSLFNLTIYLKNACNLSIFSYKLPTTLARIDLTTQAEMTLQEHAAKATLLQVDPFLLAVPESFRARRVPRLPVP